MVLLQVIHFAANGRWKWSFLLQMVAASGFAANLLFCCKWPAISDKAASGKKVATNGLAASGFAAIGSYLRGPYKWVAANEFATSAHTPQMITSQKNE